MAWITPKTDWTDDESVKYNFNDINRVENNINEIRLYLISIGYTVPAITVISGRTNTSIDYISSVNRIEGNLTILKDSFLMPSGWLNGITWTVGTGFDYTHANRWENNAKILYELAQNVYNYFKYCGSINAVCGEANDYL